MPVRQDWNVQWRAPKTPRHIDAHGNVSSVAAPKSQQLFICIVTITSS